MGTERIYSIAYAKTSALAVALGRTIHEGDEITLADLVTADLTFQKIKTASSFDKLNTKKSVLSSKEYDSSPVDDFTQAGFFDVKGTIEHIYNAGKTAVKHKSLLRNGFGTFHDTGETDVINTVTSKTEIEVTDGSLFSVGDIIKVGDNNHAIIKSIASNDLTLDNPVNAKTGDTVTISSYWTVKELETPNESFLLLIKTSFGYKVATFCRFNIGFKNTPKELLKMNFDFMGDYIIEGDFSSYSPTVLEDDRLDLGVANAFSGITINSDKSCMLGFDFELKREGKRLKCDGTEMRTGNGGLDASEYTTELIAKQYNTNLETLYSNNSQFPIFAQRGEIAIYLPACRIKEFNDLAIDDGLQIVEQKISCNTDASKDIKIILG